VVAVAFQSVFHSKMHQNNVFFNLFLKSMHQNNLKHIKNLIFNKNKINFFENTG
jgi:hypothetical protein